MENKSNTLRRQAEEIVRGDVEQTRKALEALSAEDSWRLIQDLRVHQIELELQNEELQRTEVELNICRERYFDLYDLAPVGYLAISEKGLILEVNLTFANMLGVTKDFLLNQPFTRFISANDQDLYYLHCKLLFETGVPQVRDLQLLKPDGSQFWIHLETNLSRDIAGTTWIRAAVSDITVRKKDAESLRRIAEIQDVLLKIAEAALLSTSLEELYPRVHQLVGRVLPADFLLVNLVDDEAGEIVVSFRADKVNCIPERRAFDKGMTEYIMRLGHAAFLTSADMTRLRETDEYTLKKEQKVTVCQYLGAPLIDSKGKAFGVMSLVLMEETKTFRKEDEEVLSIIAAQVSLAIERKRLEAILQHQAATDGLTGIFNRCHFLESAEEELKRLKRYGGTCSLLMMDIDHFKRVNDSFGHVVGDAALQHVARLCREKMRGTDLLGRIGGEEFAVLLLETGISEANRFAERLRLSIQDAGFQAKEEVEIPLRVSIGVAEHKTNDESLLSMMQRADKALYRAKNEGRNKVVEAE